MKKVAAKIITIFSQLLVASVSPASGCTYSKAGVLGAAALAITEQ